MKKQNVFLYDALWVSTLILIALFLVLPKTNELFKSATAAHPYLMGFVKVAILATMGEIMAGRIANGRYVKPVGLIYRTIVWGFLGMAFALVFVMFSGGVAFSMKSGLLPQVSGDNLGGKFITALLTSAFMNLIFGPTFMALHRVTDTYIDLGEGKLNKIFSIKLSQVVSKIDWNGFIGFVVVKTIPIFWIPAHTITFMLPGEYRVLMASFLSIALGGILASAKRKNASQAKLEA